MNLTLQVFHSFFSSSDIANIGIVLVIPTITLVSYLKNRKATYLKIIAYGLQAVSCVYIYLALESYVYSVMSHNTNLGDGEKGLMLILPFIVGVGIFCIFEVASQMDKNITRGDQS